MNDTGWREKHAETHGELNATLRAIDKNIDELAAHAAENANHYVKCREEVLGKIIELNIIAREAAKAEVKNWGIKMALLAAALGILGGLITFGLTRLIGG
jgi:hypothetical protein